MIAARASTFDDGGVSVSEARLLNKYCIMSRYLGLHGPVSAFTRSDIILPCIL